MNALRDTLVDYLNVRRALGSKLDRAEKLLGQFLSYLELHHTDVVTIEHALAWATLPQRSGWWHAMRLSAVRRFAVYLHTIDGRTQVPPPGLIPHGKHRATPYIPTRKSTRWCRRPPDSAPRSARPPTRC